MKFKEAVARAKEAMSKERTINEELADSKVEIGIGSVYEDIGLKNHKEMTTKANLVMEISRTIKNLRLTQTKAADILGLSQPKLSSLLNGGFRGYSVERLITFLNDLGKDVDIVIKTKPRNRRARVTVCSSTKDLQAINH